MTANGYGASSIKLFIIKQQRCLRGEDRYKLESAGCHSSTSAVSCHGCNHTASHSVILTVLGLQMKLHTYFFKFNVIFLQFLTKFCTNAGILYQFTASEIYIHSLYILFFIVFISITIYPPYTPFPPGNHYTVVHESFFLIAQSLHSLTLTLAVILLSIYESVSVLLLSSVCSLDSTYE